MRPVDLAHEPPLAVGRLEIDPAHRRLSSASGGEAILEPRVMQVLVALAREPGRILSRDDLIATCWDGVVVGDDAINRVISQLRKRLAEMGDTGVEVETITKVGYSLAVSQDTPSVAERAADAQPSRRAWPVLLSLVALVGLLLVAAWRGGWLPGGDEARPVAMTLLPVRADTPSDEALGAGIRTRLVELLNATGRIEVSGLESAALLDMRALSPLEIGRELDKDHVATLTVRRDGEMVEVRLTQLSTSDGSLVVDETYRRSSDSLALLLHDLASVLARANPGGEPASEQDVGGAPLREGDEAIFLTAVGLAQSETYVDSQRAETLLRQLEARYPDNARIKVLLARVVELLFQLDPDASNSSRTSPEALELAREAQRLAPDYGEANAVEVFVRGPIFALRPAIEKAALLDPHNTRILRMLSMVRQAALDFDGSQAAGQARWELEPLDEDYANSSHSLAWLGDAELADKQDQFLIDHHPDEGVRLVARSRMVERKGDLSEAVRLRIAAMPDEPGWEQAQNHDSLLKMGMSVGVSPGPHGTELKRVMMRLGENDPPDAVALEAAGVWGRRFHESWLLPRALFRQLVNHGRSVEVVRAYDRHYGSPEEMRRMLLEEYPGGYFKFVAMAPDTALALRDAGRDEEALSLTSLAVADLERATAKSRIPGFFHVIAARLYAVHGDETKAQQNLQVAIDRRWLYGYTPLQFLGRSDLDDDRALAPIAETRVGQAFNDQLNRWRDRERREVEPILREFFASDPLYSGSTSAQSE